MDGFLSDTDKRRLLQLAREALEAAVAQEPLPPVDEAGLPEVLLRPGCSFVTLTHQGNLRGCIGTLRPIEPLFEDVRHHAVQAALEDYRFSPVKPSEAPGLEIEISVLNDPQPLAYDKSEDLLRLLRPEVDGVVLRQGLHRATFLPQVWEHLPDPRQFLGGLCEKMGVPADTWRRTKLDVQTYQVEKFTEEEFRHRPQTADEDRR
jgi:AmmeMemoRadiSam system protein A